MSLTIYKASAGSGKTFTLAATFIAHLISDEVPSPHRHQLAVTFTNKATAEMKERILQHLYDLAHGNDDSDGFFRAVREQVPSRFTNRMIRQMAGNALQNIVHDYDHLHVSTIDSFFQSLLANLAHELGLSSSFKVEISDKELIEKAVTHFLDNAQADSDEMMWLKAVVRERLNEEKEWSVEKELVDLSSQILKEDYMLYSGLLHQGKDVFELDTATVDSFKKNLKKLRSIKRQELATLAKNLHDMLESEPSEGDDDASESNAKAKKRKSSGKISYNTISYGTSRFRPFIMNVANEKLNLKNIKEPNPAFISASEKHENLLKKDDLKDANLVEQAKEIQVKLKDLITAWQQARFDINSYNLSLANLDALRLLDAIRKEIDLLNEENNRILLANTPLLFHNLSQGNNTSFIFERAGTQYQHVMIDEFQDTSKLQWSNMRHLLVENMAQGNSCMLVGDVKQGIYRFRGGDWNALANFRSGRNTDLNATINIETLKTNFRSGEHIVGFNNRLFIAAAHTIQDMLRKKWEMKETDPSPAGQDLENIYPTPDPENDNHEVTQLTHDKGGFVRMHFYTKRPTKGSGKNAKSETQYAAELAEAADFCIEASLAEQMLRLNAHGVPFKKMAILVRNNDDAQPLLNYFSDHHGPQSETPIPLISEEAFLLNSSVAVMVIISALQFLADPTNGVAYEYVRCHCPDEQLDLVDATLRQWQREKYSGLPFYEVSCRLINMLQLEALEGQSPYLYTFLDALLGYIDEHTGNVNTFLEYWEETLSRKSIPSTAVDGVRILTIHKSKGLAFHSVFMPYCDWAIESHPNTLWLRPTVAPFNAIPLLPIKATKDANHSIYRDAYRQELFDVYVENLNLTYVAFTRARQNLLIWSDTSTKGITSILNTAVTTFAGQNDIVTKGPVHTVYEFGTITDLNRPKDANATDDKNGNKPTKKNEPENPLKYDSSTVVLNFTHHKPRLIFQQSNNAKFFLNTDDEAIADGVTPEEAAQEQHRLTGIILHLLMSSIERTEDVDRQIDAFARHGIIPATMNADSIRRLIHKRISHPTAAAWFDGSWRLYRECAIIYEEDGNLVQRRPDRVMTRGNRQDGSDETVVIDFKFGRYKPEYRDQVKQYIDLLQRQGMSNVRGYLWYLYSGSIEEVEC